MASNNELKDQMKELDKRDEKMWGFLKNGAVAGLTAGIASSAALFAAQRYSSILRSLTPQAKFATILSIGLGTSVIASENAVYRYSRPQIVKDVQVQRSKMTWPEYIFENRHPILGGTFAAAVLGGMVAYSGDKYRSGTQKFLNIRLYGQGIALMALFGVIGLGSIAAQRRSAEASLDERKAYDRIVNAPEATDMLTPPVPKK